MNDIRRVLSYNDVLLVPRNSELEHISDANIELEYTCPSSFKSIPIINAPMDKVCSRRILSHLNYGEFSLPVTIHRWFNTVEEQIDF